MKKWLIILFLVSIFFVDGCVKQVDLSNGMPIYDERYMCVVDSDCGHTCGSGCVNRGWAAAYEDPCVNVRAFECSCVDNRCYSDGNSPMIIGQ